MTDKLKQPSVSIITATYNREEELPRAINSTLDQTYPHFEHIIVDDGSTDGTQGVVEKFDDDRIQYVRLEENQGANAARNKGVQIASGDLISFLDSDDEYLPSRLETVIKTLSGLDKTYGAAYHSYGVYKGGERETVRFAKNGDLTLSDFKHGTPMGGFLCAIFRAHVFDEIGLLDEKMKSSQDSDFYIRVARQYKIRGIPAILGRYHQSTTSISGNLNRRIKGQDRLFKKHGDVLSQRCRAKHYYNRAFLYASEGNMPSARRSLWHAIELNYKDPRYYYHFLASLLGDQAFKSSITFKKRVKLLWQDLRSNHC
ncbi:glycosyltransferase family 2 protein [Halobacterium salinarum]|uniref:glycosyltransferase family 2 protein n=1 Tax=Halobacterium salinarum TaxID=2242 RepID=UPI0025530DC8|nr:glycosyltransferase family 2 protein [Halobacterium salinarum]MDL0123979.1 glycosyltransferase family 2 protein [Halobacterium salinarum]